MSRKKIVVFSYALILGAYPVVMITILNIPWSLLGLFLAIISAPKSIMIRSNNLVFQTRSWWWTKPLWWLKGIRGFAYGNIVVLGQNQEQFDLEHELIHAEQFQRHPLIFPLLYSIETLRVGYRMNRYEVEAYRRAGNIYNGQ